MKVISRSACGGAFARQVRALSLAGASLISMPAFAQEATRAPKPAADAPQVAPAAGGDQQNTVLQDIIVTAQKRDERLSDVPISVSAASGATLQKLGVINASDLSKVAPGFVYTRSAYGNPIFAIRGIGLYDETIGIAPTVSAYVDQVPLPFPRMTEGAILDLERVEVLKGPQGTLFGENSTGGAINLIAAKPTEDFHSGASLTYGRFNEFDGEGYVSGKIADDLTARLSGRIEERGDWQENYTRDASLGQRNFGVSRLLVDYKPTNRASFELNVNGWYDKSDTLARQYRGWAPINPAPTRYKSSIADPNYEQDLRAFPLAPADNNRAADWYAGASLAQNNKFFMGSLRSDYEVTDSVKLTSITAYSHLDIYTPTDNDGTALPDDLLTIYGQLASFSQELRLAGTFGPDDAAHWVVGANYQNDIANERDDLTINGSNTGVGTFRFDRAEITNDQKITTAAVFGNIDYKITPSVTVQGGIRYTDQWRDYGGCFSDPGDGAFANAFAFLSTLRSGSPTTIPPGGCVTEQSEPGPGFGKPVKVVEKTLDQDNVSWKLGLSWKPINHALLYANVTRGYKAGVFGTLGVLTDAEARPVGQESVLAYEAGFKLEPASYVQVSGAVFYYDYTDKQLRGLVNLGPPFGSLPAVISIPKSKVDGAELDLVLRPIRGLTITAGGAYVESEVLLAKGESVLANTVPDQLGNAFNATGSAFPNTPKWQLSAGPEYKFPVTDVWTAFVGATATYRSSTTSFFGDNPIFDLPGYTLYDARGGFEREDSNLRITFWGKNITNKYYPLLITRAHDTITSSAGLPATYGATVSLKY